MEDSSVKKKKEIFISSSRILSISLLMDLIWAQNYIKTMDPTLKKYYLWIQVHQLTVLKPFFMWEKRAGIMDNMTKSGRDSEIPSLKNKIIYYDLCSYINYTLI